MNTNLHNQLLRKFENEEYRHAYSGEYIFSRIPLKIRTLRESRNMSQGDLGRRADLAQPWVSKLEDPTYGRLTIATLLKLARAFDVALYVDFIPFSELLRRASTLSDESFYVPSYANDTALVPAIEAKEARTLTSAPVPASRSNVIEIIEWLRRQGSVNQQIPHPLLSKSERPGIANAA